MNMKSYKTRFLKRLVLSAVAGMGLSLGAFAQVQTHNCGNDVQKMASEFPDFWQVLEDFENNWQRYVENGNMRAFEQTASGKYIIPVVVHVLHQGGSENITRSQVLSQLVASNKDFRGANANIGDIAGHAFDSIVPHFNGADTTYIIYGNDTSAMLNRFEFRLATKDPLGNCTDGIVRVYSEKTDEVANDMRFKQTSYWDRAKYLNLWIVKSIESNTPGQTTLGYAQFPFAFGGDFPLTSTDGVVIIHSVFGTSGTASGTGATTSHEMGHWLGLFHIWGDADCGSDGIDDTPIAKQPNFSGPGCFPLPKEATCIDTANSGDSTQHAINLQRRFDIGEMWMDFMDYTDDNCLSTFSEQQYRKMNVSMESISFRSSLSTPANILATGTDDASQGQICSAAPIADLWSRTGSNIYLTKKLICAGEDLLFADGTFNLSGPNSTAATVAWDFPGGAPNASTSNSPTITYATPGDFDVTITSTNPEGSNAKTRNDYVHVSATAADEANVIYYDDFEYSTSLYEQGKWININEGNPINGWQQNSSVGYMSSKCMMMNNANNIRKEQDYLVTASYDLTTFTNDKLYFKYAGARKTNNPFIKQNDILEVYVSTNCGENWSQRQIKVDGVSRSMLSGDTMYNAGLYPSGFVPTLSSHWKQAEVDLASVASAPNVRIMFAFTSGGPFGNNFYLDQVNISNSTSIGIEETAADFRYNVYPNPVTSTSQVYFKIPDDSKVTVDVLDITGRVVKVLYTGDMQAGEQNLQISKADFNAAGIYMVRLNVNGTISTKKVVIE